MSSLFENRVSESSTSTGLGAFALQPIEGFKRFGEKLAVGATCHYVIAAVNSVGRPTGEVEWGIGTYSAANTLTRTTVVGSSNGDTWVNFGAGAKTVALTALAPTSATLRADWRAAIGLDRVDNTSDVDKPVSTQVRQALDAKAPSNSPTLAATTLAGRTTYADDAALQAHRAALQVSDHPGHANLLRNAQFRINQRNNGLVNGYPCDGWRMQVNVAGVLGAVADPDSSPAQVYALIHLNVLAARSSLGTGDYFGIGQSIEGFDVAALRWGTVDALPVTLSFWLHCSVAGTYSAGLRNRTGSRSYTVPVVVTPAQVNTWRKISVTIPGCTDGVWEKTISTGLRFDLTVACGTQYTAPTANAWQNGNFLACPGITNNLASTATHVRMSAPQIQLGTTATTFEATDTLSDLLRCQRYYLSLPVQNMTGVTYVPNGDTRGQAIFFPVAMRAAPSIPNVNASLIGVGSAGESINNQVTLQFAANAFSCSASAMPWASLGFPSTGPVVAWGATGTTYLQCDAELE